VLDASRPRPDSGVSAAVGKQDCQGISGSRLASDGDEHAPARDQGFEDVSIMRLIPDPTHGTRDPQRRQLHGRTLQCIDEGSPNHKRPRHGHVKANACRAQRLLDQSGTFSAVLHHDRERLGWQTDRLERLEPLLGPRDIRENSDREQGRLDVDHDRVIYHGTAESDVDRGECGGTRTISHDAAVIGAGPAGAWTAYSLARHGVRVLLVDGSHPREKPCGGGITGRALSIVAEALASTPLPAVRVHAARFVAGRSAATVALDADAGALIVASRAVFDERLLAAARRAGVRFVPSRCAELTRVAGKFQLAMSDGSRHESDFIIGADGANSFTRRCMVGAFRRDQLSVGTGFFARGVTNSEIVVEFVSDPPGYIWSFPRPDHLAIGVCAQADAGTPAHVLRARTAEWIRTTGIAKGVSLEPYSWPIPSLSRADCTSPAVAGPGWFLVGDAAGLVDPITREGIFYALLSAQHAADALVSHAATQPDRVFAERVRDEITPELAWAARYKSGFFRPRFTRLLVEALQGSERIRRIAADLVSGTQPYGDLKWRLAASLEVGLAARLFMGRLW